MLHFGTNRKSQYIITTATDTIKRRENVEKESKLKMIF